MGNGADRLTRRAISRRRIEFVVGVGFGRSVADGPDRGRAVYRRGGCGDTYARETPPSPTRRLWSAARPKGFERRQPMARAVMAKQAF